MQEAEPNAGKRHSMHLLHPCLLTLSPIRRMDKQSDLLGSQLVPEPKRAEVLFTNLKNEIVFSSS